jgi:hypothetical protein
MAFKSLWAFWLQGWRWEEGAPLRAERAAEARAYRAARRAARDAQEAG